MRVELAADLFGDTDDTDLIDSVNDLFRCFVSGQHDLVLDARTAIAAERFLPGHLPKHTSAYTAVARGAPNRAAWTGTSQRGNTRKVCREDAVVSAADLRLAAKLVLENSGSDKFFVVATAHIFGARRIAEAIERGWLEIEQAGGTGEIPRVALEHAGRFRRWCRVAVLYDSDRWLPNTPSKHEERARDLRAHGVTVHILLLREAENYVPHKVIAGSSQRHRAMSRKLRCLRDLTRDQHGHFDMKHGFKRGASSNTSIRAEQAELFRDLSPVVRTALHDGFGEDLLQHLHQHREALCEQDFGHLGPDAVADLRAMLDAIASQI